MSDYDELLPYIATLEAIAYAANDALRALKAAYGAQYPGSMYELVTLDRALDKIREPINDKEILAEEARLYHSDGTPKKLKETKV